MRRLVTFLALTALLSLALGATPASAAEQHRVSLTGSAEAHPGDRDARGQFSWAIDGSRLCFLLTVTKFKLPIAAAHIHRGKVGVDGPPIVELTPTTGFTSATNARCVPISASASRGVRLHPKRWYVNVHNADFPAGGLRAQLG